MTEVFWIVSIAEPVPGDAANDDDFEPLLVEFRDTWAAAKQRFAEVHAQGGQVDVFDADGELVRSQDPDSLKGRMSAPRVAGLYHWNEVCGHVRVASASFVGSRKTPGRYNEQRTGKPSR